ncbi:MAG: cytochrome-c peroxidase, partial [Flavobacteriaceae bacterium]|nr:cytochrome-c peroxidase [Flavobacteriaceae bacterium]
MIALTTSCSDRDDYGYTPTPAELQIPKIFENLLPSPSESIDNPLTEEGIALGKKLFFDPILSADNTQACASCHRPSEAFSDQRRFSVGIDGIAGVRNSMPLQNLVYQTSEQGGFNWDGSAISLEEQALEPVVNPVEMHNTWPNASEEIAAQSTYTDMFETAFGTSRIDSTQITKALAQFVRTLLSGNSKFDKYLLGEATLTASELNGLNVFMDEARGDCFHCHGSPTNPLWTDNRFHNNGLD